MMNRRLALLLMALLPSLALADKAPEKSSEKSSDKKPKVTLKTNMGNIVVELNQEKAPITVANFLKYVKNKHYDGTAFHRVIPDFMIQGGGFAKEGNSLTEKPSSDPIKNESQNGLSNVRGSIAMARTNDPDSAKAQFFINVQDNPSLDYPNMGGYAVFGKVVEGMDVVDKIKAVPTSFSTLNMIHPATKEKVAAPSKDVPNTPVIIESATIVTK